jgi:hypothetical protein
MTGRKRAVKDWAVKVFAWGLGDSIKVARVPRVEPGLQRKSSR